ncbi:MAG: arginyltransferase [Alphaproteobacteria bacterium]|nr:arginyltransferase [Alphaproteobacteria bacterium]
MRHAVPAIPQFYVTASQPCPYLPGRVERKLFTALQGDGAVKLNDMLSKQGFRRSQNVLYRPSCAACTACYSARIRVADFFPTKSQRRVLRRNADLTREASTPWATEDQFQLFRSYLSLRHSDGGMADMDIYEFAAMIEETPVRSRVVEYYRHEPPTTGENRQRMAPKPRLSAACLTDVLDDGLSMVYSFFEPDTQQNSPGTYIILDHVEIAREAGLPYVYLGYWVPGSPKMGYKSNFGALEVYQGGQWQNLDPAADVLSVPAPIQREPISDQVGNIKLPDMVTPTLPSNIG